tara:strand:- start:1321 stop:1935 length:615 start_codon:yes stop_codon:yes gene_type:complete
MPINLTESARAIALKINKGLASIFNKIVSKKARSIEEQIRPLVSAALLSSSEIRSLSSGTLRIDFGLTQDPSADIVNAVTNSLSVQARKAVASSSGIKGGVLITLQPADYSNLFSLSTATQITEKGEVLPWLEWLLTLGQQVIIADFGVEYGSYGRTGGGRMVEGVAAFKVNSQYAGTIDNNFITRAINPILPQIRNIIIKALQ